MDLKNISNQIKQLKLSLERIDKVLSKQHEVIESLYEDSKFLLPKSLSNQFSKEHLYENIVANAFSKRKIPKILNKE